MLTNLKGQLLLHTGGDNTVIWKQELDSIKQLRITASNDTNNHILCVILGYEMNRPTLQINSYVVTPQCCWTQLQKVKVQWSLLVQ